MNLSEIRENLSRYWYGRAVKLNFSIDFQQQQKHCIRLHCRLDKKSDKYTPISITVKHMRPEIISDYTMINLIIIIIIKKNHRLVTESIKLIVIIIITFN